jgi:hypothetical protein
MKAFKAGTAREEAERAAGFSANGESQWTRGAARPADGIDRPGALKGGHRTNERLIREVTRELNKLSEKIAVERDRERLIKLGKNYAIKEKFLARLRNPNDRTKIEVTTLHGEEEFIKWERIK